MRTALDPQDASFNVRLDNQKKLGSYLASRPFGAGVGSMGYAARQFNDNGYIGTIPPDSYWVLVWGMYGIVGFLVWFCAMMYIQGKSAAIVWNIKNEKLRYKLMALAAGSFGIFFSSYGNEVINFTPSSIVIYISWAFIFIGPRLDINDPALHISKSMFSKT
jgi:O-antigen ligase